MKRTLAILMSAVMLSACGITESSGEFEMTRDRAERNFVRCMDRAETTQDRNTCDIILYSDLEKLRKGE
jgi:hypothetical protein